jgi:hypothetical protein
MYHQILTLLLQAIVQQAVSSVKGFSPSLLNPGCGDSESIQPSF